MGTRCRTLGNIHTHQLKPPDFVARKAKRVQSVPDVMMQDVLDRLRTVLDD